MTTTLEKMSGFEGVKEVLRDYVEDKDFATLTLDTPLADLGIEDLDLLNILHEMKIDANQYVKDYETRALKSQDIFSRLSAFERSRGNNPRSVHLRNLAEINYAPELFSQDKGYMNVGDLVTIADYADVC